MVLQNGTCETSSKGLNGTKQWVVETWAGQANALIQDTLS